MNGRWCVLVLVLLLGGCTTPAPTPTPILTQPTPAPRGRHPVARSAQQWLTDGPRRLSRELGLVLSPVMALDQHQHAHMAYQTSVEAHGPRSHGKVVVRGTTPAGDPYETVLWTGAQGLPTTGIGAWGDRVVVTAGVPTAAGLRLLAWLSEDGGQHWGAAQQPLAEAFDAAVAFTPQGQIVLVAGVFRPPDRFQTQVLREAGPRRWQPVHAFPATPGGSRHAAWTRDPTDPAQDRLPALVVLAGRSGGFEVGRSTDGLTWETASVSTATADQPLLVAAGSTLLALHTVYGQFGLWLARSDDGGRTWQSARQFVDDQLWAGPGALLWDAAAARVFLLLDRFDVGGGARQIVLTSAALSDVLAGDGAWTPDWRTAPWTPLVMPASHTHQLRPTGVQRGAVAAILWEGAFIPPDAAQRRGQADFRATYEPTYALLRVDQLTPVWSRLGAGATESDDP